MNRILTFISIGFLIFSCEPQDLGSPSEPCTLNCSEWEECDTRQINQNDWFGPREWYCNNVFEKYFARHFNTSQTIVDNNGTVISTHNSIKVNVGFPSNNIITLNLGLYPYDNFIQIYFIDPDSGLFNIPNQSFSATNIHTNVYIEGAGSFVENGSSPYYTLEINASYEYEGNNYHIHIIGTDG